MNEDMEVVQDEVLFEDGSTGADLSAETDSVLGYQESVIVADHAFYTTPFSDYTVTEGLLLLIFVILLVDFFLNLLRRWF